MKTFCKFPTVNLNFWLVICIGKDFIWTTLKAIIYFIYFILLLFIFLHPHIPDFQIVVSRPNVTLDHIASHKGIFFEIHLKAE